MPVVVDGGSGVLRKSLRRDVSRKGGLGNVFSLTLAKAKEK